MFTSTIPTSGTATKDLVYENKIDGNEVKREWTDRALFNQFGKLTAIQVVERHDGWCIQRIRAR